MVVQGKVGVYDYQSGKSQESLICVLAMNIVMVDMYVYQVDAFRSYIRKKIHASLQFHFKK